MPILTMQDVYFGYGGPALLEGIDFSIESGERVAVIGRNGCGKSTLLRLLGDNLEIYSGTITKQQNLKIAMLSQYVSQEPVGRVFDVVSAGLGQAGKLLNEYHNSQQADAQRLAHLHNQLDKLNVWGKLNVVETVLSMLGIAPDRDFSQLSAGLKRRVLTAKALAAEPDLLILDEPTNHLDIDSISWLEDFLLRCNQTLLFVTHDRCFLKKIATRMVEIDRGKFLNWDCDYQEYLDRKEQMLSAEQNQWQQFDKHLTEEEIWLRQGVKARRSRNEGRVRTLFKMRQIRSQRRKPSANVRMEINSAGRSGDIVVEAKGVNFSYLPDAEPIIKDLTTTVIRGDRVGIIGPNGRGKTTLLKLLLNQLSPTGGVIRHGTNVKYAYFDQLHGQLDADKTLEDNIGQGYGTVMVNGRRRQVFAYLADFLFDAQKTKQLVGTLSGGERNRLQIAKIFTQPSNVLILDEPTNDLDVETLELLEDMLIDYQGTVLLVSHDRIFLNDVVTSMLVLNDDGGVLEFIGSYDDYSKWKDQQTSAVKKEQKAKTVGKKSTKPKSAAVRLTFKQQKRLEQLPSEIEQLESKIAELHLQMAEPAFYKQSGEIIAKAKSDLDNSTAGLDELYELWTQLSEIAEK